MVKWYAIVKVRGRIGQCRATLLNVAQIGFVTRFLGKRGAKLYHAEDRIWG